MSRVLVVAAVDVEARGLARHLGLTRTAGTADLRYHGLGLDLVCAGPRALHLGRLTDLARTASLVVSAGTCGALAPHLGAGDLVVPDTVLTLGACRYVLPRRPGLSQAGALLSVDHVVETAQAKARLWQDTAALAVDMESATIVEWAETLGLPAIVIRGVSDTATHGVPATLADIVDGDGRTRTRRAVWAVFSQPRTLPRALALRRGTAAALRAGAAALRALSGAINSEPVNESGGRGAPRRSRGAPNAGGLGGRPEPPMYSVARVATEQGVIRTGRAEDEASSARRVVGSAVRGLAVTGRSPWTLPEHAGRDADEPRPARS